MIESVIFRQTFKIKLIPQGVEEDERRAENGLTQKYSGVECSVYKNDHRLQRRRWSEAICF
jgi:hypothetical protein